MGNFGETTRLQDDRFGMWKSDQRLGAICCDYMALPPWEMWMLKRKERVCDVLEDIRGLEESQLTGCKGVESQGGFAAGSQIWHAPTTNMGTHSLSYLCSTDSQDSRTKISVKRSLHGPGQNREEPNQSTKLWSLCMTSPCL